MKKLNVEQMERIEGGIRAQEALQVLSCIGMVAGAVTGDFALCLAGYLGC